MTSRSIGEFWKIFEKNMKKMHFFSKIFQKKYIELPILEVVLIGGPIKITYFFQVVLIAYKL